MCQADSDRAMAPRRYGRRVSQLAQVTPVLLLLIKESVFEGERLLCQFLVPRVPSCACEMGQGPADADYAMCKATNSFPRVATGPASLPFRCSARSCNKSPSCEAMRT
jgi:hypothetical protein